jgi:hypothetical protein
MTIFSSQDIVYRNIVHYFTIYIVIESQYNTFFITNLVFEFNLLSLSVVGQRAIWLSYLDFAASQL